jgi:hypothetical protein
MPFFFFGTLKEDVRTIRKSSYLKQALFTKKIIFYRPEEMKSDFERKEYSPLVKYFNTLYLRYTAYTGLYMLTPNERFVVNSIFLTILFLIIRYFFL